MSTSIDELRREFAKVRQKYHRDSTARFIGRSKVRAIVWEKTGGFCWYCGCTMNPFTEFCIDHVSPQFNGGNDEFDNLVPSCRSCNHRKGSDGLGDLRRRLAAVSPDCVIFSEAQTAWLRERGIEIPEPKEYHFYFERAQITENDR